MRGAKPELLARRYADIAVGSGRGDDRVTIKERDVYRAVVKYRLCSVDEHQIELGWCGWVEIGLVNTKPALRADLALSPVDFLLLVLCSECDGQENQAEKDTAGAFRQLSILYERVVVTLDLLTYRLLLRQRYARQGETTMVLGRA